MNVDEQYKYVYVYVFGYNVIERILEVLFILKELQ